MICFDWNKDNNSCDIFNGTAVVRTHSATFPHDNGELGFYNGNPTTVSSYEKSGRKIVETLFFATGWIRLADHPKSFDSHNLVGLENGHLFTIGGVDRQIGEFLSDIWRLKNNNWIFDGNLEKPVGFGTALKIGNMIFCFSGDSESEWANQRIDLDDSEIIGQEIISDHEQRYDWPILFHVHENFCV